MGESNKFRMAASCYDLVVLVDELDGSVRQGFSNCDGFVVSRILV